MSTEEGEHAAVIQRQLDLIATMPELFDKIGHDWDTAFGQDAPVEGMFRVPISQSMMLFELSESGDTEMGTYHFNNAISKALPKEYIWTGSALIFLTYENTDLVANMSVNDGFVEKYLYENNDFLANVSISDGFAIERVYENNDFKDNGQEVLYFSEKVVIANADLLLNAALMLGFTTSSTYENEDLLLNGVVISGYGIVVAFSNDDFLTNESFNDGFTY